MSYHILKYARGRVGRAACPSTRRRMSRGDRRSATKEALHELTTSRTSDVCRGPGAGIRSGGRGGAPAALQPLLALAQEVESKRIERKLTELLEVVHSQGLKEDRRKQILIFTEHKDTLDYLIENLSKDFEVASIHGQMKLADRIGQERYFRETAQIMVATEAAGEGVRPRNCSGGPVPPGRPTRASGSGSASR